MAIGSHSDAWALLSKAFEQLYLERYCPYPKRVWEELDAFITGLDRVALWDFHRLWYAHTLRRQADVLWDQRATLYRDVRRELNSLLEANKNYLLLAS